MRRSFNSCCAVTHQEALSVKDVAPVPPFATVKAVPNVNPVVTERSPATVVSEADPLPTVTSTSPLALPSCNTKPLAKVPS